MGKSLTPPPQAAHAGTQHTALQLGRLPDLLWVLGGGLSPPCPALCIHAGRVLGTEPPMEGVFWPCQRAVWTWEEGSPWTRTQSPWARGSLSTLDNLCPFPLKPPIKLQREHSSLKQTNKFDGPSLLPPTHSRASAPAAPANCPGSGVCPPPILPQPQRHVLQSSAHRTESPPPAPAWPPALPQAALPPLAQVAATLSHTPAAFLVPSRVSTPIGGEWDLARVWRDMVYR